MQGVRRASLQLCSGFYSGRRCHVCGAQGTTRVQGVAWCKAHVGPPARHLELRFDKALRCDVCCQRPAAALQGLATGKVVLCASHCCVGHTPRTKVLVEIGVRQDPVQPGGVWTYTKRSATSVL